MSAITPPYSCSEEERDSRSRPRPLIRKALQDFIDCAGKPGQGRRLRYDDKQEFDCTPDEFKEFRRIAPRNLWKLKYVYNARRERLAIHMPSFFHDNICGAIFKEWVSQVEAAVARLRIENLPELLDGPGELEYEGTDANGDPYNSRIPDMFFWPEGCEYPSFLGEVSHSQGVQDLREAAEDELLGSRGVTRVVFTIKTVDMENPTVQVWRVKKVQGVWGIGADIPAADQALRQGNIPRAGKWVTLFLSDFYPDQIPEGSPDDSPVRVSYHRLSQIVVRGRQLHLARQAAPQYLNAKIPRNEVILKRQRTPEPGTPPEERERESQRRRTIEARQEADDAEWLP